MNQIDDSMSRFFEQHVACRIRREDAAVARQRKAQRLIQAIHAVGGEHAAEQLPQVGQAFSSMSCSVSSDIRLADTWPTASNTVARSIALPSLDFPAFIGPPLTKIAGIFTRADAEHHAGHDLVAIGDAYDPVEAMCSQHRLDSSRR